MQQWPQFRQKDPQYWYIGRTCKQGKPDFTVVSRLKLYCMQLAICLFPHLHFDFTSGHESFSFLDQVRLLEHGLSCKSYILVTG